MPTFRIDGHMWHYATDDGAGPTAPALVLLHGVTANLHVWDTVVDALHPHFRLYRPDLLGHGQSDKPLDRAPYGIPQWADGVRQLMDHWDLAQAVVLGHSMGGMVALEFTLTWPERVAALGLLNTTPGPIIKTDEHVAMEDAYIAFVEEQGLDALFTESRKRNPFTDRYAALPGGAAQVREQYLLNTVESVVNTRYALREKPHHTPRLGEITCPTAVFLSEHDEQFTAGCQIMAAKIPDATLHAIPDAGHTPQLENPTAAAEVISAGLCALLERVTS